MRKLVLVVTLLLASASAVVATESVPEAKPEMRPAQVVEPQIRKNLTLLPARIEARPTADSVPKFLRNQNLLIAAAVLAAVILIVAVM